MAMLGKRPTPKLPDAARPSNVKSVYACTSHMLSHGLTTLPSKGTNIRAKAHNRALRHVYGTFSSGLAPFAAVSMTACRRAPSKMVRSCVTGGAVTWRPTATVPAAVMLSMAASGCRSANLF